MASQPNNASQYNRVSGTVAGTTLISPDACNFNTVTVGANYTGTVTFYDSATAPGTTSTNLMIAVNNNSGSVPVTIQPYVHTKNGLVAVSGGTVDMLIGWDK